MNYPLNPKEYRYVLSDFVRSGINIQYTKVKVEGDKPLSGMYVYFPYITYRQYAYYMYMNAVCTDGETSSIPQEEGTDKIDVFMQWDFFCQAFGLDSVDNIHLHVRGSNTCFAFILDYRVRFLEISPIEYFEHNGEFELVPINLQSRYIRSIYNNYINTKVSGNLFYPIFRSLEWFYLADRRDIGFETIINSIDENYNLKQDRLIINYVLDEFPKMSEREIIEIFSTLRDNYIEGIIFKDFISISDKELKRLWYNHTAQLMSTILELDNVGNIAKKVRKVRAFCKNDGVEILPVDDKNIPHLKRVRQIIKDNVDFIYYELIERDFIDDRTRLSDFKYYMTGELEDEVLGKVYWLGNTIELVDFLSYITKNRNEWTIASKIFIDKNGNQTNPNTLKSTKHQYCLDDTKTFDFLKI